VKVRALLSLTFAAGFTGSAFANPPAPLPVSATNTNPNQTLADDVAYRLRASGHAAGADVSIEAREGIITLSGAAKDAAQKARIVADAQGVKGVLIVRDSIRVPAAGVVQVQDPPVGLGPLSPAPVAPLGPGWALPPAAPPAPAVVAQPIVEPAPLGVPGQAAPDLQAPNLPPYAWPTYAPYNNVSRVAYPQAYPYNAFPFIGPYYPFPKVPLGWRKVTLEWEDGHWDLGRNTAPQDYWKVRFW
jgi:hypothetical protein